MHQQWILETHYRTEGFEELETCETSYNSVVNLPNFAYIRFHHLRPKCDLTISHHHDLKNK